jgi:hypothetical protein
MDLSEPGIEGVLVGRPTEGQLTFGNPAVATDGSGYTRLPMLISAQGLSATVDVELESWGGGAPSLVGYFADMAAGWRGWVGTKEWHDDGATVSMSATHDGVGTVSLRVSIDPATGWEGPGAWKLEVVVGLDPGSLDAAVSGLRRLLD